MELTKNLAQNIVDRMMKDIPYNINIMDQRGIIIGSGNKKRVGTLHHGAVEAIRQGKVVEITEDEESVKKGINSPIELDGKIVGVVGISGEVNETRPFGNLVRSTVILLIEQSIALENENLKYHQKLELFNRLVNPDSFNSKELAGQALAYGIQLTKPSQVVYMESSYELAEEAFKPLPCFKISNLSLCLILQEANQTDLLLEKINQLYPDSYISVSNMNTTVYEGYQQAKAAMRVLYGVFSSERTIFYARCDFIADMAKLLKNDAKMERLAHLLEKNEELVKTLQSYLFCNLNANETASLLMIHRNTLNYRLGRIHSITGKDPKNFLELVELVFMLVHRIK